MLRFEVFHCHILKWFIESLWWFKRCMSVDNGKSVTLRVVHGEDIATETDHSFWKISLFLQWVKNWIIDCGDLDLKKGKKDIVRQLSTVFLFFSSNINHVFFAFDWWKIVTEFYESKLNVSFLKLDTKP